MTKKDMIRKSSLLEKSLKYAYKECIPLVATFEINQTCNFKCTHCYNFDRNGPMPEYLIQNQLSDQKILDIIEELSNSGTIFLNFSGGEASLHPKIDQFISHSVKYHMQPRLKTNGYSLTKEKVTVLKESGLSGADLSLYGASEQVYKEFTGKEGAFDKVICAIKNCLDADLDLSVSIILHRKNVPELSKMIKLCKDLGAGFQIQTEVTERYDQSIGAKETEVTGEQYESLLKGQYSSFFKYYNSNNDLQCSCARSVCGISSTGDVYPCIGAPIKAGNIKTDSFQSIWKNSPVFKKIREINKESFKECSSCSHIDYCNRSSGGIYANTGNYTGCDTSTFEQARIQHKVDLESIKKS